MTGLKRSSIASNATEASFKKRRTESRKEPKFYAVRAGKAPGVYLTWPECQEQISGFSGAQYKAFSSEEDAHDFVAGKNPVAVGEPDKFYAVAVGNPPGIYTAWTTAQAALKGVAGPKYKRFATKEEAEEYIAHFSRTPATSSKKSSVKEVAAEPDPVPMAATRSRKPKAQAKKDETDQLGSVTVWTDGSSLSNGRVGAAAGVGVWFGILDERNISEPLPGELQTNQRAELMAIKRALEIVPANQRLHIKSDSQYAINCVTQWGVGWARKEWKTSAGQDVKNKDIIQPILGLLKQRESAGTVTDWSWVKGHSSDAGNDCADRLAVAGAKKGLRLRAMGKPVVATQKPVKVVEEAEDEFGEFEGEFDEDEDEDDEGFGD